MLDKTRTAMGKRLIKFWIEQPLVSCARITQRLNAVDELFSEGIARAELGELMQGVFDMERLMTRVVYGSAGGRELKALSKSLEDVYKRQMLKITAYAQRLLDDLDKVDYIDRVKTQQRNWIGRSTGAEVDFTTTAGDKLRVYTTRPDTLFGATYMVISPEHPILEKWAGRLQNLDEIKAYQEEAARKSDFERTEVAKDKTGVRLNGVMAINPVNGREIPIFLSDYVLISYGTGAIMAVPALSLIHI